METETRARATIPRICGHTNLATSQAQMLIWPRGYPRLGQECCPNGAGTLSEYMLCQIHFGGCL